jgi:hypothetical protein
MGITYFESLWITRSLRTGFVFYSFFFPLSFYFSSPSLASRGIRPQRRRPHSSPPTPPHEPPQLPASLLSLLGLPPHASRTVALSPRPRAPPPSALRSPRRRPWLSAPRDAARTCDLSPHEAALVQGGTS